MLPYPFDREYMQLALLAAVVVGAVAPTMGVFLVQRRLSLFGDGIGHVAFAGVAAGALLEVWPVWTALVAAVAGAVLVEQLRARGHLSGDVALAVCFYGGLALGVVLLGVADSVDTNMVSYLFGSILTVTADEVRVVVALGLVAAVLVLVFARSLFAVTVDDEWSRVAGLPVQALNTLLSVLVAVTIVAAMRVVGILLVAGLMVLPVASAQVLGRSQRAIIGWSVAIGVASAVVGLAVARQWALAPGGTIVLVSVAVFVVASIADGGRRRVLA
jgi:zinc transport system permease protein